MPPGDIPRRAEAVVVGGGCMGASAAFHLARRGVDVVLLEMGHLGSGATGHSGAIVRQHYESRVGIRIARDSLLFFQRFQEETGASCDFRRVGFLSGARERDLPAFEALFRLLDSEGVPVQRLTPEEARLLEPQMAVDDCAAFVFDPDAGYADPIAAAAGFASGAQRAGAAVLEGREVRGVIVRSRRVAGVRFRRGGAIASERVLLAAGNWTPALARGVGAALPIRFVRGEVAILHRPVGFGAAPKVHFDFYGNTYSRPEGEKDVLVGYLDSRPKRYSTKPALDDDSVAAGTVRDLRARLARRFPAMARAQPRGGWAGLYDMSPDGYPIVDAAGPVGLFVAVGFSGHGFKLSPEVGRLAAEFVATGRRPDALAALRGSRFRDRSPVFPEAPFPSRRGSRLP